MASVLVAIPMLIVVLVLISFVKNVARGRGLPADEWIPAAVVLIPLFLFTVPFFLRQRRQRKQLLEGKPAIGAFFGPDALLWTTAQDVCYFFPKSAISSLYVEANAGRTPLGVSSNARPDWIELRGSGFRVVIPGLMHYEYSALVQYMRAWDPKIAMRFDSRLGWPEV